MRPCCRIQEWKRAESLSCTPKHSLTVALQSRPSADRDRSPYERTSTWAHIYTVCLRLHLYVSASDVQTSARSVCLCVCALYPLPRETGLLPGPDSVIGSSENPNEAMSISAAAWLPLRSPRSPRALTPSPLASLRTRCKERRDGICWKIHSDSSELQTHFSCCEGDCGKIWPDHKWRWQIIVEAVWRGVFWTLLFSNIKKINKPELDLMYSVIKIKKLKIPGWHFHQDCQEKKKNCFGTFINWKQKRSALLVKVTPLLIPHSHFCAEICMRSFRLQRASHSK